MTWIPRAARGALFSLTLALVALGAVGAGGALAAPSPGAVFTETNATAGNAVLGYDRAADGALTPTGSTPAGGTGTGGGLGNQGAVALAPHRRLLFAVNAGSNTVAAFAVERSALTLLGTVPAQGTRPISLTVHRDLLYVLDAGGTGDIAGFRVGSAGELTPIAGSVQPLSSPSAGAAQVAFSPDGKALVVTEKATSTIDTYAVDADGVAGAPVSQASNGQTPFGFAFDRRGTLIVSEAFGGAPGASALSSYRLGGGGLELVSGSVRDTQTAACWVVITKNGRFAYTTNTGSGTISSYAIGNDGALSLIGPVSGVPGGGPTDAALNTSSRFLYAISPNTGTVSAFAVDSDGGLDPLPGLTGLPAGATGLAAR